MRRTRHVDAKVERRHRYRYNHGDDSPRRREPPFAGSSVTKPRPLRADARRNRQRVLEVAEATFADEGLDVPIDEIARRAGFGVGTLYRHFPTKEALFSAIVIGRIERATAHALELARVDKPGDVFFEFLSYLVDQGTMKKDFVDALAGAGVDLSRLATRPKRAFRAALAKLLSRAQAAGAVRKDATVDDVVGLIIGLFTAIERQSLARRARARLFAIVCDGLRSQTAHRA
jgi:AcrR family transcriptional regulator